MRTVHPAVPPINRQKSFLGRQGQTAVIFKDRRCCKSRPYNNLPTGFAIGLEPIPIGRSLWHC
jgi:hypothetical protein